MGLFKILLLLGVVALLVRTFLRQIDHGKELTLLIRELGFTPLGETMPEAFPLAQTSMANATAYGLIGSGMRGRREVLIFDYGVRTGKSTVATTVVAARGGEECFPTARTSPGMHVESAGGWTMVFRPRRMMAGAEVKAFLMGIPA